MLVSYVRLNAKPAATFASGRNRKPNNPTFDINPSHHDVRSLSYVICLFFCRWLGLEGRWVKLDELGRKTSGKQNARQQVEHEKLYSDLP